MLRKIFGPIQESNEWIIMSNRELNELSSNENVISFIKSARLRWAGHIIRMDEDTVGVKVFNSIVQGDRAKGPRKRWISCVEVALGKFNV